MSTTETLKNAVGAPAAQAPALQKHDPNGLLLFVREDKFQKQLRVAIPQALSKALTPERLTRVIMTECRRTPDLLKCNKESFCGAILMCAQLGLEPGGALGHCYLLPFGNGRAEDGRPNAQLIIGYRGMIDLARRSGQIQSIHAFAVHQKDDFEYELGLEPKIKHKPSTEADPGPLTFVYAVAKLVGGGHQFEVLSRAQIENIRGTSKAGKSGPWNSHYEEMAKKSAVRRLFKYLPVSLDAAKAVEVDEKTDRGEAVTMDDFLDADFREVDAEPQKAIE